MGGTFHRLCEQHHDVHVAYETSGNIAVGDEEVIRYCEYLRDVCAKYTEDETVKKKAEEIIHSLRYEKVARSAGKKPVQVPVTAGSRVTIISTSSTCLSMKQGW